MRNKIGYRILALVAAIGLLLTGCAGSADTTNLSAVMKTRDESTYYNGYLGLTVTVPEGFYVVERNQTNLTQSSEESADLGSLEVTDNNDGGFTVPLIDLQNKMTDTNSDHAEMTLYCEIYEDWTYEEYLEAMEYMAMVDWNGYTYEMIDSGIITLNNRQYTRYMVEADHPDNSRTYIEEYYITREGDLNFVVYVNYWSESDTAKDDAYRMLDSFGFGAVAQGGDQV